VTAVGRRCRDQHRLPVLEVAERRVGDKDEGIVLALGTGKGRGDEQRNQRKHAANTHGVSIPDEILLSMETGPRYET
jgi:hypothetical protein